MSSTCPRATCVAAAPASSRSPSQTCSWSYFAQLSSLIITEAKKLGLRVIVEPTLYSREGELDALHGSQTAMVDGLIYSPLELGPDDAAEVEVDYPLVLIGERIFTDKVDHIATENVEGAKRATSYLLQTGCKRVAVVGVHPGRGGIGSAALRFRGYREALEEAGVPFDPALVVPSIMWHRNDGVAAMNTLLDSGVRPDGVVALNDMLASGVMHSIQMARPADSRGHFGDRLRQLGRFAVPVAGADVDRTGARGRGAAVGARAEEPHRRAAAAGRRLDGSHLPQGVVHAGRAQLHPHALSRVGRGGGTGWTTPHCRRRLVVVRSYGNVRAAVRQPSVNARSWSA